MLSTEEFRAFAKDYVLFSHVTTRLEGEKHGNLLSEKGGNGFPYVVAMDADGGVIAHLKDRTVDGFKAMMQSGRDLVALVAKKDRTAAEDLSLLELELGLGRLKPEEARARAGALKKLDDAAKKKVEGLLLSLDVKDVLAKITSREPQLRLDAGKAFAEMWKAGREPADDESFQPFFILMLDHAEAQKDAALFEKALAKLRAKFADKPNTGPFFAKQDERLAKLKEAK